MKGGTQRANSIWKNTAGSTATHAELLREVLLRAGQKEICGKYKKKNYLVAVFESGEKDLYQGTLNLLAYNKRRSAELEVQKAKKAAVREL